MNKLLSRYSTVVIQGLNDMESETLVVTWSKTIVNKWNILGVLYQFSNETNLTRLTFQKLSFEILKIHLLFLRLVLTKVVKRRVLIFFSSWCRLREVSTKLISTQTVIPRLQNNLGDSVFHILVRSQDSDMIGRLITCTHNTGDFHTRNLQGDTPLTLAIREQYLDIATLLLNCTWKVDLAIFSQLFQ